MASISKFLQGFRLVTGDALNNLINAIPGGSVTTLTVNGAIDPHTSQTYVLNKSGVLAATLAAPSTSTDDGTTIIVTSNTAQAHTVTATGLLQDGSTTTDVATFAAHPGASLTLMAYQGKWNVISSNQITFS